MYIGYSQRLNDLINLYFQAGRGEDVELKIAGNQEERALMMPLLYIDCDETKAQLSGDMTSLLEDFQGGKKWTTKKLMNPANRMKAIDVVKVLMGIRSTREAVQQYAYKSTHWAKLHEYDYEQVLELAEDITHRFYVSLMSRHCGQGEEQEGAKRRKLET